jgi:diguanylate cyclase
MAGVGVFRKLDAFPFTVVVSRDRDAVFQGIERSRQNYLAQAGAFSAAVLLAALGLTVMMQRQHRLFDVLAKSEQDKHGLIQELEQEKVKAYELASHDFLTGIPNRMLFHEMARAEFARAKRSRKLYALFFMDLDKFKAINDTLGHAVGDRLLQAVAGRLRANLRDYDLLARLGGDEFVMLISEVESEEFVADIAAKLVASVSQQFVDIDGHDVSVSPSIGIALYPRDGQTVEMLLKHADAAMYGAKSGGRGAYRFFDASLNESTARQLELLARFRTALRDNEFCLHYQPRVMLGNFELAGLEALVRWQHPEHGLIYPNEFVGLAEQYGLIAPLGEWVINEACRQLAAWRERGLPLSVVAVNVSARQLQDETLVQSVGDALARHGLPPELLEIEVTESCFIEDTEVARRVLEALRARGLKIAIDDYGTGFSGLSSLKSLPIYAIKIDRSFVRDIRNDASDAMIVASTITLAHNLGLTVVAEGVESREQIVHLKTAGCDQVQGFYFQRPVCATEIEPVLQRRFLHPE